MKKNNVIGIITICDYINIGNRLQNYAVYKILRNYGHVENIEYTHLNKGLKYYIYILIPKFRVMKLLLNSKFKLSLFLKFSKTIPKTRNKIYRNLNKYENKYNYIFYGSDQIWNPEFIRKECINPISSKEKNIAFAASIGVDTIPPEYQTLYMEGLQNFKEVSVRETQAAKIMQELTGIKAEILMDPTLYLTKEQWVKLERRPVGVGYRNRKGKPYILLYFLGEISEIRRIKIQNLAEKYSVDIIDIMNSELFNCIGPSEFIYLIHNSFFVITDSYHGSVFSFIFDKQFYVLRREDNLGNMCSRFDTFFDKFNLYDHYNDDIENYTYEHDYSDNYMFTNLEREKYNLFLESAFL